MDKFKINISSLKDGQYNFEIPVLQDEVDITDFEILDNLNVFASLYKAGNEISAKIGLTGKLKLQCDRCLEDYNHTIENKFHIIYKMDFKGEEDNDLDDDIKFISPNTRFIDLKNDIRDYILLSLPMKKAPAENDGICTYCHRDTIEMLSIERQEDTNPIWEKLLKTKTKQEK